jgi:hypothetical protein
MGLVGDLAGRTLSAGKTALGLPSAGGSSSGGPSTLDRLLLAASVADTAAQRARERGLQNKAIDYATGAYDEKSGIRKQALTRVADAMGGDTDTPDFSGVTANPYQKSGYLLGAGKQLGPAVPLQKSGYLVGAA